MSQTAEVIQSAEDTRYPIGRWSRPAQIDTETLQESLQQLKGMPQSLSAAVHGLTEAQIDTPYRADGWTVRQLVHHLADSHMNCFVRIRLALTEEAPEIKPYDEKAWAMLADSETAPIAWSLSLLEALHARLLLMLNALTEKLWQRTYVHPVIGPMTMEAVANLYAWHGAHHVAHIVALRTAKGW